MDDIKTCVSVFIKKFSLFIIKTYSINSKFAACGFKF